jgi:lysophospholipase L1-like esterase
MRIDFPPVPRLRAPLTAVLLGDSITANCNRSGTANIGSNLMSWFEWANAKSQAGMVLLNNAGVAGNTTAQMLARVQSDVVAYSPAYCIVMGGQNDPLDTSGAVAGTYSNLLAIYAALNASGIYVIALSVTPDSTGTANHKKGKSLLNAKLRDYWSGRAGGEYVDVYSSMVDPLQVSGNPISSTQTVVDGVHPGVYGSYLIGSALAPVFQRLNLGRVRPLVSSTVDNIKNNALSQQICNNPLFEGTGGTVGTGCTGTVADRWAASCSGAGAAAMSLVSEPNGYGYIQRAAITASAGSDTFTLTQNNLAAWEALTAGATYVFDANVTLTSPLNLACVEARLNFTGGSGPDAKVFSFSSGYGNGPITAAQSNLVYRSLPITLPAGTYTGAAITFTVYFGGVSGSLGLTLDVSRVGIWRQ